MSLKRKADSLLEKTQHKMPKKELKEQLRKELKKQATRFSDLPFDMVCEILGMSYSTEEDYDNMVEILKMAEFSEKDILLCIQKRQNRETIPILSEDKKMKKKHDNITTLTGMKSFLKQHFWIRSKKAQLVYDAIVRMLSDPDELEIIEGFDTPFTIEFFPTDESELYMPTIFLTSDSVSVEDHDYEYDYYRPVEYEELKKILQPFQDSDWEGVRIKGIIYDDAQSDYNDFYFDFPKDDDLFEEFIKAYPSTHMDLENLTWGFY